MTDRYNGFVVILEKDIREDDAEATIAAIKQIKGVLKVKPNIGSLDEAIAAERIRYELRRQIFEVLK